MTSLVRPPGPIAARTPAGGRRIAGTCAASRRLTEPPSSGCPAPAPQRRSPSRIRETRLPREPRDGPRYAAVVTARASPVVAGFTTEVDRRPGVSRSGETVRLVPIPVPKEKAPRSAGGTRIFEWERPPGVDVFLVEFGEEPRGKPLFSAFTPESPYALPAAGVEEIFAPGKTSCRRVKGCDAKDNRVGESPSTASRSRAAAPRSGTPA